MCVGVCVRMACGRVYRLISHLWASNPYSVTRLAPPPLSSLAVEPLPLMMCERYAHYYYHLLIAVQYIICHPANFAARPPLTHALSVCLSAFATFCLSFNLSHTPPSHLSLTLILLLPASCACLLAMCVLLPFVSELVIFALLLLTSIHNRARAGGI